ncbi:MAG: alpha-galactosidase [Clostridiaceae bacterium]|nr:alpha-galactosidase [Clostridiaceae bacterium]
MERILNYGEYEVFSEAAASCTASVMEKGEGRAVTEFCFRSDCVSEKGSAVEIRYSFPILDICGRWHPNCRADRALKADWELPAASMTAVSAPVVCFFNSESRNRYTIAASELCQEVDINAGVHEEDGRMAVKIQFMLSAQKMSEGYSFRLWESQENIPYWDTLNQVRQWWEDGMPPVMEVPEEAREPVYSFWYSWHQDINASVVEEEAARAAEMGFDTIIVDDGWQTGDNNRGYAFCGDWAPEPGKFPDFPEHIRRVHAMGIKYMLWFSVPFVGKNTGCWDRFSDKLLCYDERQRAGVLDLRYQEVREYLLAVYIKAVREWDLDGLKLDFIDEFYMREETPVWRAGMDYRDIQEALDVFMTAVRETLRREKESLLIEFRQRYIGPNMRRYGNMFRVADCPCSPVTNRVGCVDLRLLCGDSAVHSDMLMWNRGERPEEAAMQVLSCLFGVPQISVRLADIDDGMAEMLRFWLNFMRQHRTLLQMTVIRAKEPENLYPEVSVENETEEILVHYSAGRVIRPAKGKKICSCVNALHAQEQILILDPVRPVTITVKDCRGNTVESMELNGTDNSIQDLIRLSMPACGLCELRW